MVGRREAESNLTNLIRIRLFVYLPSITGNTCFDFIFIL
jgi:hypothetical protein